MKLYVISMITMVFLAACSGNYQVTSADEIFDATDGTSNHVNDPDSDL